jgi:hypothetical protein
MQRLFSQSDAIHVAQARLQQVFVANEGKNHVCPGYLILWGMKIIQR